MVEAEQNRLSRWTADGKGHNFSAPSNTNKIEGIEFGFGEGQIAVDSSEGSPFKGDVYTSTNYGEALKLFAEDGEELGEITVGGEVCGVAVDQSNGDVYAGIYPSEIKRYRPAPGAAAPVDNSDYEEVEGIEYYDEHCNIDASADGHVYSWPYYGGAIQQFDSSDFAPAPFPSPAGTAFHEGTRVESDPSNGDVYVDLASEIIRYSSGGSELESFGAGVMSGGYSNGIGVNGNTGHIYASDEAAVLDFSYPPPYAPIDNPAVVHGVRQAGTHDYGDFQVTPSGELRGLHDEVSRSTKASTTTVTPRSTATTSPARRSTASPARRPTRWRPATPASPPTASASPTTAGSSSTPTSRSSCAMATTRNDVYEWEEDGAGPATGGCDTGQPEFVPDRHLPEPDLDRHQPVRLEPALGHRGRHRRVLLHPRHAGP